MRPRPWSFTALGDFLNCPKAYYEKRIAKSVVESQGEAALWGDAVHKGLEQYLLGGELPENLENYREYADKIKARAEAGTMLVEQQLALNTKMQPCDWLAEDAWCRGIVDVLILFPTGAATVIDHKTGKVKAESKQLKLFALLVFAHYPSVAYCNTEFSWLAHDQVTIEGYHREREAALWQEFLPDLTRWREAHKKEVFNPRQSGLCFGWCPVTGCEFWKPKKVK